jgi:hypothetical protein
MEKLPQHSPLHSLAPCRPNSISKPSIGEVDETKTKRAKFSLADYPTAVFKNLGPSDVLGGTTIVGHFFRSKSAKLTVCVGHTGTSRTEVFEAQALASLVRLTLAGALRGFINQLDAICGRGGLGEIC